MQIQHMVSHRCIQPDFLKKSIKLSECDNSMKEQKWTFTSFMNETALLDWKNFGRPLEDDERAL